MRTEEVQGLVGRVAGVDADCVEWGVLKAGVEDVRRLKSWVEGREVAFAQQIAKVSSFPEKSLAQAGRTSLRHGEQLLARAETAGQVPELGASLDAGRVAGEHVDVFGRTLRQLKPEVRSQLLEETPQLVLVAEQSTPEEFGRTVRQRARALEREGDGLERLERQRRAIRMNGWTDKDSGMRHWTIAWDPDSALWLEHALDAHVEALFHDSHPEGCPTDLLEKQAYLRAHALRSMLHPDNDSDGRSSGRGKGVRVRWGRPGIVVVEDHSNPRPDGKPTLDWGLDVELPDEFLEHLRPTADVYTVKVRNGVVIDAPGVLNLGRTTRLANRAQRRALRGLYATCAIPGCRVHYNRTKLHHVVWWRHGGISDLDNFLPLCELHHQKIHHHGWLITLGPHRELTITLPDGQIMTTGPPKRHAA